MLKSLNSHVSYNYVPSCSIGIISSMYFGMKISNEVSFGIKTTSYTASGRMLLTRARVDRKLGYMLSFSVFVIKIKSALELVNWIGQDVPPQAV